MYGLRPGSFGAPKQNPPSRVTGDPTTFVSSADFNPLADIVAQLSQLGTRMRVLFPTITASNPTVSWYEGEWESSDQFKGQAPTITRTGTGTYVVQPLASSQTGPGTWTNSLQIAEMLAFSWSRATVDDASVASTSAYARTTRSATSVTVQVFGPVGGFPTPQLTDLGGGIAILVEAG